MTEITIPPEAVEAHAKALLTHETWGYRSWDDLSEAERDERIEGSEVAIRAALAAWPGAAVCHYTIADDEGYEMVLPLPFPQEKTDAEA